MSINTAQNLTGQDCEYLLSVKKYQPENDYWNLRLDIILGITWLSPSRVAILPRNYPVPRKTSHTFYYIYKFYKSIGNFECLLERSMFSSLLDCKLLSGDDILQYYIIPILSQLTLLCEDKYLQEQTINLLFPFNEILNKQWSKMTVTS